MPTKIHPSVSLLARVRNEVRVIRILSKGGSEISRDPDAAHSREDKIVRDVVEYIASGKATKNDAVALCQELVKSLKTDAPRWCA